MRTLREGHTEDLGRGVHRELTVDGRRLDRGAVIEHDRAAGVVAGGRRVVGEAAHVAVGLKHRYALLRGDFNLHDQPPALQNPSRKTHQERRISVFDLW
jgi:hypothetical protein